MYPLNISPIGWITNSSQMQVFYNFSLCLFLFCLLCLIFCLLSKERKNDGLWRWQYLWGVGGGETVITICCMKIIFSFLKREEKFKYSRKNRLSPIQNPQILKHSLLVLISKYAKISCLLRLEKFFKNLITFLNEQIKIIAKSQ